MILNNGRKHHGPILTQDIHRSGNLIPDGEILLQETKIYDVTISSEVIQSLTTATEDSKPNLELESLKANIKSNVQHYIK